jgi:hypothetical protein
MEKMTGRISKLGERYYNSNTVLPNTFESPFYYPHNTTFDYAGIQTEYLEYADVLNDYWVVLGYSFSP